jgi:hypothetical protein
MKKLILLFFAALCIIIASCSKDSGFDPGSDPFVAMSKGYPSHTPVINYKPAPDGNDTEELLAILTTAEPGSVIKLLPGEYKVGEIELHGFEGMIVGSGRDKTIIYPAELIKVFPQQAQPPDGRNLLPCWWRIIGGDVTISDLTFKTGDDALISDVDELYKKTLASLIIVNNYSEDYGKDDPQPMNFTFKNVNILCGKMDPVDSYMEMGYNVLMPLWIGMAYWWPPVEGIELTKGNFNVVNCYFESGFDGFEFFSMGEEAVATADRVKTDGCAYGTYCTANFNSRINITNSTFMNSLWYDVFLEDNDWGLVGGDVAYKRCQYLISGNTFIVSPGIQSLVFQDGRNILFPDYNYEPTLAMIKNNVFNLKEESTGISLLNNSDGQVRNNRFTGTGSTGIYVDGADVYDILSNPPVYLGTGESKNVLILGNNFTGLNATKSEIWFGPNSKNCTVVGNGKESVIDDGTNNKIVGMKMKLGGNHAGPSIRNNFRMWHGIRHH